MIATYALLLLSWLAGCSAEWTAVDQDGDAFGRADGDCWDAVQGPEGSALAGADIHPGAQETWYDGIDQDCAGDDDYDVDGDGYVPDDYEGLTTLGVEGTGSLPGGDCWDDLSADDLAYTVVEGVDAAGTALDWSQPAARDVHPEAVDTWYDGIDQDCDGTDDFDQDGDGWQTDDYPHWTESGETAFGDDCLDAATDLDFQNPAGLDAEAVNPSAEETWYDGTDQDCDDNDCDADGDGFDGDDDASWCNGDDCDDTDASIYPDDTVTETWYDGIDQNCDTNDGDADGDGYWIEDYETLVEEAGGEPLEVPDGYEGDCDDEDADVNPDREETWYDGTDQDCDGNDGDYDGDGYWVEDYESLVIANGGTPMEVPEGYEGDCDDTRAEFNPDAVEYCDGVDNDCDDETDESDAIDASTWHEDADDDGFGDALSTTTACDCPTGYVKDDTDCDDADNAVNPDADESCYTPYDDDCDGDVNEADAPDAPTWYIDADGDGYGVEDTTTVQCEQPFGYAALSGDCDEDDASVNPGADETWYDGIDQDCADNDGDADGDGYWIEDYESYFTDTGTSPAEVPEGYEGDCDDTDETVYPGAEEIWYDGIDQDCDDADDYDADGDGYEADGYDGTDCDDTDATVNVEAEEICGDGLDNDCDGEAGADCGPWGPLELAASYDLLVYGSTSGGYLGRSAATVGDVDGDGLPDFLVGAPYESTAESLDGSAYLFQGALTGTVAASSATATLYGPAASAYAGTTVAGAGDVNGDGYADLLVGSAHAATSDSDAGMAWLVLGPVTGSFSLGDSDRTWYGEASGDEAGQALSSLDDIDGDGLDDVAVTAPATDTTATDAGTVYLLSGPVSTVASLADAPVRYDANTADAKVGSSLGSGDLDGDGVEDLVLGAPYDGAGVVWVVNGPHTASADLSSVGDARILGETTGDTFGSAVSSGGDVDGDGHTDLLVTAPFVDGGYGRAYLFTGPVTGLLDSSHALFTLEGPTSAAQLGYESGILYDLDADAYADLLVGASDAEVEGAAAGSTYVIQGPLTGSLEAAEADILLEGTAEGDYAGWATAAGADLDGDGYSEILVGAAGYDHATTDGGALFLLYGGAGL